MKARLLIGGIVVLGSFLIACEDDPGTADGAPTDTSSSVVWDLAVDSTEDVDQAVLDVAQGDSTRDAPVDQPALDTTGEDPPQDSSSILDVSSDTLPNEDLAPDVHPDAADLPAPDLPAPDLPLNCGYLTLTDVAATSLQLHETVAPNSGRSFRVHLVHWLDCHQRPAMPRIDIRPDEWAAEIQARVWSENFDCLGPSVIQERYITLRVPTAGTWTVRAGDAEITVEVSEPTSECQSPGIACQLDCDCSASQVCLSAIGVDGNFLECAEPCERDLDCVSGRCTSWEDGFDLVCAAPGPPCDEDLCPSGYACADGDCAANFRLSASNRVPCFCDEECESPLRCVRPAEDDGPGRCEITCSTATGLPSLSSERWCGPMHACSAEGENDSVCQWLGE